MNVAFILWLVSGVVLLWLLIRLLSAAVWWSLGYRRFLGTWYSPLQYSALMSILKEDLELGRRLMRPEEIRALVVWQNGGDKF